LVSLLRVDLLLKLLLLVLEHLLLLLTLITLGGVSVKHLLLVREDTVQLADGCHNADVEILQDFFDLGSADADELLIEFVGVYFHHVVVDDTWLSAELFNDVSFFLDLLLDSVDGLVTLTQLFIVIVDLALEVIVVFVNNALEVVQVRVDLQLHVLFGFVQLRRTDPTQLVLALVHANALQVLPNDHNSVDDIHQLVLSSIYIIFLLERDFLILFILFYDIFANETRMHLLERSVWVFIWVSGIATSLDCRFALMFMLTLIEPFA